MNQSTCLYPYSLKCTFSLCISQIHKSSSDATLRNENPSTTKLPETIKMLLREEKNVKNNSKYSLCSCSSRESCASI